MIVRLEMLSKRYQSLNMIKHIFIQAHYVETTSMSVQCFDAFLTSIQYRVVQMS